MRIISSIKSMLLTSSEYIVTKNLKYQSNPMFKYLSKIDIVNLKYRTCMAKIIILYYIIIILVIYSNYVLKAFVKILS